MNKAIDILLIAFLLPVAASCGSKASDTDGEQDGDIDSETDQAVQDVDSDGEAPLVDVPPPDGVEIMDDCLPVDETCTEPEECCTGICYRGVCSTSAGVCENPGVECVTGAECCSGHCEREPDGVKRCQSTGGCLGAGEECAVAADCCSLFCDGGLCAEDGICSTIGDECSEDYDCCSNICEGDQCVDAPGACQPLGEACGEDGNCCSENCEEIPDEGRRCVGDYTCRIGGEVCTEDDECCSLLCDEGYCAILSNCTVVGEPCTGYRECCSGACADSGIGTLTCQYLSGCRSILELCEHDTQCCSGECDVDDHDGVERCVRPGGCLRPGEVCWSGSANNCCGGHELCIPTIAGVSRCFESDPDEDCIADGDPCHFSDECCCGLCVPDEEGGALTCCPGGIECVPDGGACITDIDCCSMACIDGVCGEPDTNCIPLGGFCETDEDCCSDNCNESTNTCWVPDLI